MANEYAVNRADLVRVADAIREKGKTSDQLVFPSGFVSAVDGIKAGGLNFEVVGSTEQPANPKENTIWVETDQEITGWSFADIEPVTTPEEPIGHVWFTPISRGKQSINALAENTIQLYLNKVFQRTSGEWTVRDAMIYVNGEWCDVGIQWLFESGYGENALFDYEHEGNSTIDVSVDRIKTNYSSTNNGQMLISAEFDATGLNTLYVEAEVTKHNNNTYVKTGFAVNSTAHAYIGLLSCAVYFNITENSSKKVYTLPISELDGIQKFITVGLLGAEIYNIWCE